MKDKNKEWMKKIFYIINIMLNKMNNLKNKILNLLKFKLKIQNYQLNII